MRLPSKARLLTVSFVALALAGGAVALRPRLLPDTPVLPGLTIDGVRVPAGEDGMEQV